MVVYLAHPYFTAPARRRPVGSCTKIASPASQAEVLLDQRASLGFRANASESIALVCCMGAACRIVN